jgi:hypothetical protein
VEEGTKMLTKKNVVRGWIFVAMLGGMLSAGLQSSAQACGQQVNAHAGWIIAKPITSFLFWPTARSDAAAYVYQWAGLLNNASFYSRVAEYGVNVGTAGALVNLTSASVGALDESTIQYGLYLALVAANRVPKTGEVFVILLPQGTTSKGDTGGSFGHHYWINATFPDGKVYPLVYAVIEYYSDAVTTDVAISHELYETYTDPIWNNDSSGHAIGLGWWDDTIDNSWSIKNRQELADMCENHNNGLDLHWTLNGATLAQLWSQNACTCQ